MFDPLAVMLVIAYNQALIERNKQSQGVASIIKKDASAFEEDNERMDIIGQNGNDGLHYDLIDDSDVEPREENDPRPYNPDLTPTAKGGIETK